MDPLLLWGLVLLAISVLLTVIEIFVPTAGLLGLTSVVVAVAGIVCLFKYDGGWGLGGLLSAVVLLPSVFFGGIQIWRNTEAGRRAMGIPSDEEIEARQLRELRERQAREAIIGMEGVVLTDLRPVGVVELDGKRVDALADEGFIQAGRRVRVTAVEATEVRVRTI